MKNIVLAHGNIVLTHGDIYLKLKLEVVTQKLFI